MEFSCFICGDGAVTKEVNITNLHLLFRILCQRLDLTDLRWEPVEGVNHSIFCGKCYDLLMKLDRVNQIVISAERELKAFLTEVEGLIAKSQWQKPSISLRNPSLYEFRRRVAKKFTDSGNVGGGSETIGIKEEFEYETIDYDNDDLSLDDDDVAYMFLDNGKDKCAENAPNNDNVHMKNETGTERENGKNKTSKSSEKNDPLKTSLRSTKGPKKKTPSLPPSKKEKINLENAKTNDEPVRRTSSRVAKKSAEQALKQYACSASDDDDDNYDQFSSRDEPDEDYQETVELRDLPCTKRKVSPKKKKESKSENESDSDDSENDDQDYEIDKDNHEEEIKKDETNAKDDESSKPTKRVKRKKDPNKFEFHPFLVAGENLYLYQYGTFVVRTNTHLQCKAHLCDFQVEFEVETCLSSFQEIRKHIEEKHRTRRHSRRIPHPCLVCNIMLKRQPEFRKHLRTVHLHHLNSANYGAKAICEVCLKPDVRSNMILDHMFGHKNAAEKAIARAKKEGTKHSLKLRESEIPDTERKFVCDYENCTYAAKYEPNLKRHKRSHLPKEQRNDVVVCPDCGKLILKETLREHIERVHHPELVDSLRILYCPICNKRFYPNQRNSLEKHIRLHKGEKPFLCTECGKSYAGMSDLKLHQKEIHGDNNPVKCDWCDKVFNKYRSMRSHARVHHPDKYGPVVCQRKLSKFYYDEAQDKSSPNFIGPRQQFPCPICDTLCKYRITLKVHMQRFHNPDGETRERKRRVRKNEPRSGGDDSSSSVPPTELPSSSSFPSYGPSFANNSFSNHFPNYPNESSVQDLTAGNHY